eukprot:SAG11_NODE_110_length_16199_cov_18.081180_5_plen_145_part_00
MVARDAGGARTREKRQRANGRLKHMIDFHRCEALAALCALSSDGRDRDTVDPHARGGGFGNDARAVEQVRVEASSKAHIALHLHLAGKKGLHWRETAVENFDQILISSNHSTIQSEPSVHDSICARPAAIRTSSAIANVQSVLP